MLDLALRLHLLKRIREEHRDEAICLSGQFIQTGAQCDRFII